MTGMFLVGPLQHKLAKIFSEIMTQIEPKSYINDYLYFSSLIVAIK
jgi:hypothetical protein